VALALAAGLPARAETGMRGGDWHLASQPSIGPARSVGGYAAGCLAGARALAPEGPGYQVIRLRRHRNYGHPELVDYVQGLGRRLEAAHLGPVLVGDMSQPRGGPMPKGHASHQVGLDADFWLRLDLPLLARERREELQEISMVDFEAGTVQPKVFTPAHVQLLRLAAADPRVERIFVNPVIKAELCRSAGGDRSWLRLIRPWYGHDAHFHVRLRCPADSPECVPQKPLPPGEGCDEDLFSWLSSPHPAPKPRPDRPARDPMLPASCHGVLQAGHTPPQIRR
jgi:penicillin-insensitive murein endopeptidase